MREKKKQTKKTEYVKTVGTRAFAFSIRPFIRGYGAIGATQ